MRIKRAKRPRANKVSLILTRLGTTQGKLEDLDRKFQNGNDVGKQRFSGKVDPLLVVSLAEERMKKLLDTYDADKTVSSVCPHSVTSLHATLQEKNLLWGGVDWRNAAKDGTHGKVLLVCRGW